MRRNCLILAAAAIGYLAAQTTTPAPRLYTYYLMPGDKAWSWKAVTVDPPLKMTVDSAGLAHLTLDTSLLIQAPQWVGFGLSPETINGTWALSVDSSLVPFRVVPPSGPGVCDPTSRGGLNRPGAWAADAEYFYFCVGSSPPYQWGRIPLQTTWSMQ